MYLVYSIEHANRPFCICHLMVKLDENTVYNSCQINFEGCTWILRDLYVSSSASKGLKDRNNICFY